MDFKYLEKGSYFNPLSGQCCPHIENNSIANQLTGFYMRTTLALNGLIKILLV